MDNPSGHKPHFNIKTMRIVGKKIYVPHAGITLRTILDFASDHHYDGSRYYDVECNGVHLAKVAIPTAIITKKRNAKINADSSTSPASSPDRQGA